MRKHIKLLSLCLTASLLLSGCSTNISKNEIVQAVKDKVEQKNSTEEPMESKAGYYLYLIDDMGTSRAEIDTTYFTMVLNQSYVSPISTMTPDTAEADLNTFVTNASDNIDETILESSNTSACLAINSDTIITLYYQANNPFSGANSISESAEMYSSYDGTQTLFSYEYCTGFANGTNPEIASALNESNVYFYYDTINHLYGEIVVDKPIEDDVDEIFDTLRNSTQTLDSSTGSTTDVATQTESEPIKSFGLGGATQQYSTLDEIQQHQISSMYEKQDTYTMLDGTVYNLYLCTGACQINGIEYEPDGRQWLCLDSSLEPDVTYGTLTSASIVESADVTQELSGYYIVGYDLPYNTYTIDEGSIEVYSNPPILSLGDGVLELNMVDPVYEVTAGQIISISEGTYIKCTDVVLSSTVY